MAITPEAVERSEAYIRAQDAFHDARRNIGYHSGAGNHLPATIHAARAAGSLVLMGWRSLALVREYNRENIRVRETDGGQGPIRAMAEAIVAESRK